MSTALRDYDYELPRELIAQRPLANRTDARMMVLDRAAQSITHLRFTDFPRFVREGDLVVLNDTFVVRARHFSDDGAVEFLFLERMAPQRWRALVKPGRKARVGSTLNIRGAAATIVSTFEDGSREVLLDREIDLHAEGTMPLPPYINRTSDAADDASYQTVFARDPGSVAAPTAGLHFTNELMAEIPHAFVTLHIGTGTFRPVKTDDITAHQMHTERYSVAAATAERISAARRVLAVGTTTVRVLESMMREFGGIVPYEGATNIFIYPPFEFRAVDVLLTNFHLPRSTLLMLVSAFAGREFVLQAYAEAVRERYRFFSYGDCMLIL